ncbi:mammalian ependymin-related protein 1-like isoform X1 [Montipora foliosa]|uniref:mammalian ependymin-related protein 1-like isoform X1 n=1 Tax=Montipora foliosa TaxID=591990 RepID=UPI0035F14213
MFAVLVSLLLVVLVNVEGLKPCDAPEVWNARSMTIDPSKNYTVFSKLSYDAIDERLSMDEMVYLQAQKERMFYKFIFLYKEQVLYQLRMENMTEKCIKNDLTEPFKKIQVPKNATSMGDLTIGSNAEPGLGVNIAVFAGKTPEGDPYYLTVTEKGCVPVSEGILSKKYGYMHTSFFDVELGVDPNVFVPPESCG